MTSAAAVETPRRPRLSPFVFPSDTTFRFALLVVAVLGANLYVWNWLWIAVGADQRDVVRGYLDCTITYDAARAAAGDLAAYTAANDAFSACVAQTSRPVAWWMLGGTALLLAVAGSILFAFPAWIQRRRRLRPLERDDAPAVLDELGGLAREAGLAEEPRWLWNPLDPAPTGLAFGRPGRHAVALTGGLVTRQVTDPPAFRAVVRHELAHLRNRDVDVTYATLALWYAFLLAGVLPFVVVLLDEGLDTVFSLGWRLLALAALVYLTRNAVLRAREVYADVRASVPDGPDGALRRLLAAMPRRHASSPEHLVRVHPDPSDRLAALDDTRRLFPLSPLVVFGAGVAATIAYESVVTFVGLFLSEPLTVRLLSAVVFAPLAMGVVGVGIWRASWGALAEGGRPPGTWTLALALAAGFLVGPELALERGVRLEGDDPLLSSLDKPAGVLWTTGVVVALWLLLAWVGAGAAAWLRALAGAEKPRRAVFAGLVAASGVLAVFVGIFYLARDVRPVISASWALAAEQHAEVDAVAWAGPRLAWQLLMDPELLTILRQTAVFLALVALWAFPLAAWLRRRAPGQGQWAFLDPGGATAVPPLGRTPLDPWRVGLIGGVVFLLAEILLRVGLRSGVAAETRALDLFLLAFFVWQLGLAVLAQGVVGAIAAARAREAPALVCGLAAAALTGTIATVGIVVGPTAAGCLDAIAMNPGPCAWSVEAGFAWDVLRQVVAEGAVAALAGGLVVVAVRALARRPAEISVRTARAAG
jgi:Zn-dependent protease with chaperone function